MKNWIRDPRQIGAWMDKDGKIEKIGQGSYQTTC